MKEAGEDHNVCKQGKEMGAAATQHRAHHPDKKCQRSWVMGLIISRTSISMVGNEGRYIPSFF